MTCNTKKRKQTKRNFNPHLPCGRWPWSLWVWIQMSHFNPHLPCGRWPRKDRETRDKFLFQSTPSLRKVTSSLSVFMPVETYFNPHLPCGRWQSKLVLQYGSTEFQSTPSLRKVTILTSFLLLTIVISIHTFLAEGDMRPVRLASRFQISIHTFLAEGDFCCRLWKKRKCFKTPTCVRKGSGGA